MIETIEIFAFEVGFMTMLVFVGGLIGHATTVRRMRRRSRARMGMLGQECSCGRATHCYWLSSGRCAR